MPTDRLDRMFDPHPNTDRRWLLGWVVAFGLLVAATLAHQARLRHVESIPVWSVTSAVADSTSPTGYADGRRQWISPTREQETYGWIARTQHLFATGELRHGRIDWDNAPEGRADHAPTLYTLWIAGTAWLVHAVSEGSLALAAERAALWADPAVALGFLLFAGGWMWRAFSARATCVLALGWVLLQPLASAYLPGALDPRGLAWALLAGSLLAFGGALATTRPAAVCRRGAAAGALGALAAAIDPATGLPVILAIALGAVGQQAWNTSGSSPETTASPSLWRWWSAAGALATLLAAIAQSPISDFRVNPTTQPGLVTAAAWLALGEGLAQWSRLRRSAASATTSAKAAWVTAAGVGGSAVAGLIWLCAESGGNILSRDPLASRLSPGAETAASSLAAWLTHDGLSAETFALLSVLAIGVGAAGIALRRERARALALVLPAAVLLALGSAQLRLLAPAGAALLVIAALSTGRGTRGWAIFVGMLALAPGVILARPPLDAATRRQLSQADVEAVIERDLAAWLAQRSGAAGSVVLAAPKISASLTHHAPLRGVASLAWENEAGLRAAVRIARASSPEEAQALLQQRDVRYIVLASWDTFLEDATRPSPDAPPAAQAFVGALQRWVPLRWLRPIPYRLPRIGGFEDQSVIVLEVVDEQSEPRALSLQAEYFLETGQSRLAEGVVPELRRFPADLGARIALARIAAAGGEPAAISAAIGPLLTALDAGADRSLAWDRRVALAALLEQTGNADRALVHLQRCLRDATPTRLRALTTGSLYRLLAQAKRARLLNAAAPLWQEGLRLLPSDLAHRLAESPAS